MSQNGKYYLTTTLPYVNASPHIGFAAEIVRADAMARAAALRGLDVFFNTGTDEHGLKIYRKAEELGVTAQAYCDEWAAKFGSLREALNLSYNNFIRTTDEHHVAAAQEFWRRCAANGDIYKKAYSVKYCVGCELEKTDSELVDGRCPHHPNAELELIEEENYFFRFSKFQEQLLKLYDTQTDFVVPSHRLKEIRNFVAGGLQDFSISRLQSKMPWGVPVPGDEEHVMYVWFDALVNYVSALGWPASGKFEEFWPGRQVAGKDNLRQQSAMWQAMLCSAGLPFSEQVLIFGFVNHDGQKMSKSLGNVVNPYDLVEIYGTDAVRYYILAELSAFEDSDYTEEKFRTRYTADLVNGIGNLAARVSTLLEKNAIATDWTTDQCLTLTEKSMASIEANDFNGALQIVMAEVAATDAMLTEKQPWKLDTESARPVLAAAARSLLSIGLALRPYLPTTAEKLITTFSAEQVRKSEALFPRLA